MTMMTPYGVIGYISVFSRMYTFYLLTEAVLLGGHFSSTQGYTPHRNPGTRQAVQERQTTVTFADSGSHGHTAQMRRVGAGTYVSSLYHSVLSKCVLVSVHIIVPVIRVGLKSECIFSFSLPALAL